MRCPTCNHTRTRILRTRPDPDSQAADLVRQCKSPGCLTVFTSREAVVSLLEKSQDGEIVREMAARVGSLSAGTREALLKLLQVG